MANIAEYYASAYSGLEDKIVMLSMFNPMKNIPCRVEHLAGEVEKLGSSDQCLFHTWAVFDDHPASGRGKSDDISALPGVFLDIDVGEGGRYVENGKNRASSLEEIKAKMADWGLPLPSALVSTGNGIHAEFRFDKPFIITTKDDRKRALALLKGFNGYAIQKASESGITMDSMGDLARVKRAVGSSNWKDRANPKPVEVLELHLDRVYPIEELEGFKPAEKASQTRRAVGAKSANQDRLPQWDLIAANCPFVGHCVENASSLSYPYWFALLGIAARCEGGVAIAHEVSSAYLGYKASETDAKIAEVLKADGPATYAHIRNDLGFHGMDADILASRMHSPIQFGYGSEALIKLQRNHAYDLSSERFYELSTMTPRSHKAFDMAHGDTLSSPVAAFRASSMSVKAASVDYLPGEPRLVGGGKNPTLNAYCATGLMAKDGDCSTILNHFAYLIPDAAEREHVLRYMAHLVQKPAIKITSALLYVGGQGNGKSTVARWLTDILGDSNVKTLPSEAITSQFQADRTNIQALVLNEVTGIDRAGANGLKSWITEETMQVHEKGTPRFKARTPRGVFLITNNVDGLDLEDRDRRYAVIDTTKVRAEPEYFTRLNQAAATELPAFAAWLARYDISAFDPHAPAPQSALKLTMTRISQTPLEDAIQEAWDNEDGCFRRDFGTAEEVISTVMGRGFEYRRPRTSSVGVILSKMGFEQLPQQRVADRKHRFWVWRDWDRWSQAEPAEVANHFLTGSRPANDNLAPAHAA